VIGAGETGKFTLEAFRERGVTRFIVANRTLERAERAARELGGRVVPLDRLAEALADADLVISCVQGYAIGPEPFRAAASKRRAPILAIDISVPRSLDPRCGEIEDVFLYDIDDLATIAADNLSRRQKEIARAEEIVEREAQQYLRRTDLGRAEDALRARFEEIAAAELGDSVTEERVRRLVDRLLESLKNGKHDPVSRDLIRRLFDL
jgi:glutamyl-tRNA reductase